MSLDYAGLCIYFYHYFRVESYLLKHVYSKTLPVLPQQAAWHIPCLSTGLIALLVCLGPPDTKLGSAGKRWLKTFLHWAGLWANLWGFFWFCGWCGRTKPTVGDAIPGQESLGIIRKPGEQTTASKSVSRIPPRFPALCLLEYQPWLPLEICCDWDRRTT